MLDEIISYHRFMVELLLLVLLINLVLPTVLRRNSEKMVFWSRVGYFGFWMFWSMNLFAGLIVYMFTGRSLTLSVIVMIVAAALLGVMDGYRAVKSGQLWRRGLESQRLSGWIIASEIVLIALVSWLAIGAK